MAAHEAERGAPGNDGSVIEDLFAEVGALRVRFVALRTENGGDSGRERIRERMRELVAQLEALAGSDLGRDVWFAVRMQRARAWLAED